MSKPATVIRNAANDPVADVYWGYWISDYNVSGPVAHDIEGGFHYIFSNDSFVGSVDISAQTPIVFNLLQPSPLSSDQGVNPSLSLTGGFLVMQNSEVVAQLTFLNGANPETLTGNLSAAALANLPEIQLIPGSTPTPGQISSATVEGFFVGNQAEGIASWITANKLIDLGLYERFQATAVFQR